MRRQACPHVAEVLGYLYSYRCIGKVGNLLATATADNWGCRPPFLSPFFPSPPPPLPLLLSSPPSPVSSSHTKAPRRISAINTKKPPRVRVSRVRLDDLLHMSSRICQSCTRPPFFRNVRAGTLRYPYPFPRVEVSPLSRCREETLIPRGTNSHESFFPTARGTYYKYRKSRVQWIHTRQVETAGCPRRTIIHTR